MGKAYVYKKEHINTDEIIPARFLNTDDERELARHCMEDIDGDFVDNVQEGDFIVAGKNFGCGSSREHAVWAIRGVKVAAVIAVSFARIFYRNAINCGFLVVELPGADEKIRNGDQIEIDVKNGKIVNKTSKETYEFTPLPDFAIEIIQAGGLLNKLAKAGERE